jgi:arylformamidase
MAISGLFDLSPIAGTPFLQPDLRLTPESVGRLSPVGFPAPARPLYTLVGADESDEFRRQNRLLYKAWGESVVPVCEEVAGANHFTVLHELADPASRMHRLALQLLGLPAAARA